MQMQLYYFLFAFKKESHKDFPYSHRRIIQQKGDFMAAIVTILSAILCATFFLTAIYFLSDYVNKTKTGYCCMAICFVFFVITLLANAEVKAQTAKPSYQRIVETKVIEHNTLCFKNGAFYDPSYYANVDLVEFSAEGFYRVYITRYSKNGSRVIPIVTSITETDEPIIDKNCHVPYMTEYVVHTKLLNPEGKVCWEECETRYSLNIPPNAIKKLNSFKGS